MICPKCEQPVKVYSKFCLNCGKAIKIPSQKLYFKRKNYLPLNLIFIAIGAYTLFIPYLLFWSYWVEKNKQALNTIDNNKTVGNFQRNTLRTGLITGVLLVILLVWGAISGRSAESIGLVLGMIATLVFFGTLVFVVWVISYFVLNIIIYKKLTFLLESNRKELEGNKISLLASFILGPTYFQPKINKWLKFVKPGVLINEKADNKKWHVLTRKSIIGTAIIVGSLVSFIYFSGAYYAYFSPIRPGTAQLAIGSGMNMHGRKLLYSANPVAATKSEVDKACENKNNDGTIEYGCFYYDSSGDAHIYVLILNDSVLKSNNYVTAAHEMLHNAYSKLSPEEKSDVDKLVGINLLKLEGNKQLDTLLEPYKDEPQEVRLNEAHSLLSVMPESALTPELNEYYSKYFSNRYSIILAAAQYNNEIERYNLSQRQIESYLKWQDQNIGKFESVLSRQNRSLNFYSNSGNYYGYNSLVEVYNSNIEKYRTNIKSYNEAVNSYNKNITDFENRLQGVTVTGISSTSQQGKNSNF